MKFTQRLSKRSLLPGFEAGAYESRPSYDRAEFDQYPERRSNHVNIRLSDSDLERLHQLALREGVPLSSLIAGIVRCHLETAAPAVPPVLPQAPAGTRDPAPAGRANRKSDH